MVKLPLKFVDVQLFPAICIHENVSSIRANFGMEPWCYNLRDLLRTSPIEMKSNKPDEEKEAIIQSFEVIPVDF